MASKRTRIAMQQLADDCHSANEADYFGPSKRQTRENEKGSHQPSPEQTLPIRATRSLSAQQSPEIGEDEEDQASDDDEPVNVNFNTVVSVSNHARRGRPRTVNGVQPAESRAALDPAASDGEGNAEEARHEEQDDDTSPRSALYPFRRQPAKPLDPTPMRRPSQRTEQQSHGRSNDDTIRRDPYDFEASPPGPRAHSSPRLSFKSRANTSKGSSPSLPVPSIEHDDDDVSFDSSEDGGEEAPVDVGEDSAFIEAPRPGESLPTVEVTINSVGGMVTTLGHSAWTGYGKWAASFDSTGDEIQDDPSRCRTTLGKRLMDCAKDLKDTFEKAADAAYAAMENDDGDQGATEYLRNHNDEVASHLKSMDTCVENICKEGLANTGDVDLPRGVTKTRRKLLKDIARQLIPMIVLVIQSACDLVLSEASGAKMHLQLSSFTLQFFLRIVGCARRIECALNRGLEQWPFDPEFRQDEEQLDSDDFKSKQAKQTSRNAFKKQISALHYKFKEAERTMQNDERKAKQEEWEEQCRQRKRIEEQERRAKEQRDQAEKSRRDKEQYDAFCWSTQVMKHAPDPFTEIWDAKEKASSQLQAPTRPDLRQLEHAQQGVQGPLMNVSRAANQKSSQPDEPWGLDWTLEENKILVWAIRYDQDYHAAAIAAQLQRTKFDVERKAAAVKAGYRSTYTGRGWSIPEWAL